MAESVLVCLLDHETVNEDERSTKSFTFYSDDAVFDFKQINMKK